MGERTNIEWADSTWNPVTGCTKITKGCDNCYAERHAERFRGVIGHPYQLGFDLHLRPERLNIPGRWDRPRRIFVCSMSDLFHKRVPNEYLDQVFDQMDYHDRHTYLVLTKRSSRMRSYFRRRYEKWDNAPNHIWAGVSIEDRAAARARLMHLIDTPARTRYLSIEPLLGPIGPIDLKYIDWVIVGGESGPRARLMEADWVREIRDRCSATHTPFFFKQWGGRFAKSGGRELDGRTWDEYPCSDPEERHVALPF